MDTVKQQILAILNEHKIGSMTTVHNNRPYSRYMTFTHEDFTLYTRSLENSEKVLDLQANPYTHILIGYTNDDADAPYLEFEGKVTEFRDDEIKLKVTNFLRNLFGQDSDMIAIQIEPVRITLLNKHGHLSQTIDFAENI